MLATVGGSRPRWQVLTASTFGPRVTSLHLTYGPVTDSPKRRWLRWSPSTRAKTHACRPVQTRAPSASCSTSGCRFEARSWHRRRSTGIGALSRRRLYRGSGRPDSSISRRRCLMTFTRSCWCLARRTADRCRVLRFGMFMWCCRRRSRWVYAAADSP